MISEQFWHEKDPVSSIKDWTTEVHCKVILNKGNFETWHYLSISLPAPDRVSVSGEEKSFIFNFLRFCDQKYFEFPIPRDGKTWTFLPSDLQLWKFGSSTVSHVSYSWEEQSNFSPKILLSSVKVIENLQFVCFQLSLCIASYRVILQLWILLLLKGMLKSANCSLMLGYK